MKWFLGIVIVLGLTSSSLSNMNIENQLLNQKWMLLESKTNSNHHQFTNKQVLHKNENFKTSLIFKENGVLIERHGPESENPFFISDWKFVKEKQMLKISNSRHWDGLYDIDHLDQHSLKLSKR